MLLVCAAGSGNAQLQVQLIHPKTEFNIKQASEMLNEGNAEIKGVAYMEDRAPIGLKVGETIYAQLGTVVMLFPMTAYMEEYLEIKKKNKPNKRLAAITPLAYCYRIESKVYGNRGEFIIKGLKPGKYYLETNIQYLVGATSQEVSGLAEITRDGESLDFKLKRIY